MKTLFKAIVGSQAYGTNTPTSDVDIKGIYLQDPFSILGLDYKDQYSVSKDETYYEVKRFLELLQSANPTMLELLFIPENCVLEKDPLFDIILKHKYAFLTKGCKNSFVGYAKQQIYKAKGLDKKMNWESSRVERKTPIDFMKTVEKGKTFPLVDYLKKNHYKPEFCGLTKINNTEGLYCLYYDHLADIHSDNPRFKDQPIHGYKGICNEFTILLSEIPTWQIEMAICHVYYNPDSFTSHCKDYNSYQTWLNERNTARYVDVKNHGQMIDGKNMMHCIRLIETAKEIAETGNLTVHRENAEELLKIRRGEVSLEKLLAKTDELILEVDSLFEKSELPAKVDRNLVNEILLNIRKESLKIYGI